MSKKNSSVNLKNGFQNFTDLSKIFIHFKKLDSIKKNKFVVAVSGGPDSLVFLAALTKSYTYYRKSYLFYVLVNHNIRKESLVIAKKLKIF